MLEVTVDVLAMDVEIHGGATVNADAALDESWTTDISCSSIIEDRAKISPPFLLVSIRPGTDHAVHH